MPNSSNTCRSLHPYRYCTTLLLTLLQTLKEEHLPMNTANDTAFSVAAELIVNVDFGIPGEGDHRFTSSIEHARDFRSVRL